MRKQYLSRHDSRRASLDIPVGDPFGGPAYGERNDPMTAMAVATGTQAVGAVLGANAQEEATQAASDAEALRLQAQLEQAALQRRDLRPFRQAGTKALEQFQRRIGRAPQYADIVAGLESDPGYQFELAQGQKAIEGSAAARGLLRSGRTLTGLTEYAQGLASTRAGEAYQRETDRYLTRQNQLLNLISGGQNAAAGTGVMASNALAGSQLGNLVLARGDIQSGMITNLANTGTNALQNLLLAQQLQGGGAGGGMGFGGSGAAANANFGSIA